VIYTIFRAEGVVHDIYRKLGRLREESNLHLVTRVISGACDGHWWDYLRRRCCRCCWPPVIRDLPIDRTPIYVVCVFVLFSTFLLSVFLLSSVDLFSDMGMTHVLPWLSLTVSSVVCGDAATDISHELDSMQ